MLPPDKKVLRCEQCGEPLASGDSAAGCLNCLLLGGLETDSSTNAPPADATSAETLLDTEERGPRESAASSAAAPAAESLRPAGPTHRTASAVSGSRFYQHYEILARADGSLWELGRGAMGITYKAMDVNLRVPVALKVISARFSMHPQARSRFLREARSAARLRHPNVASVFHFGTIEQPASAGSEAAADGPPPVYFYAMEFIEGETLEARVRRAGPLGAALTLEIAAQVCRALMAAEKRGLVHRDLKPANIMLTTEGEAAMSGRPGAIGSSAGGEAWVKVIDFGLAKAISEEGDGEESAAGGPDGPLTHGGFVGTPQFASPEQYDGGEVDARSDIFSLGVTLWFALTGGLPFDGRSLAEIYDLQHHRPLPTALLADVQTPAPLAALLESMLAADPEARPSSAGALRERIEQCQAAVRDSPGANGGPFRPDGTEWSRPARWLPTAAALGMMLLAAGGAVYLSQQRHWQAEIVREMISPPMPDKSLAVLPLENLSTSADDAFFASGIQDDIIANLVKIRDLRVISRSSVAQYKAGEARNLREISRQLGVSHVLEGSVRRDGFRVILNLQLTDTAKGKAIWSEHYDQTLSDSLTLQSELATRIAAALRAELTPEEKASVDAKATGNADAYVLYLRGREYQTSASGLLQDYRNAARLYEEAIALDPGFALARARLSATLAYLYLQSQPVESINARARMEAEEALRLQPNLGEGHLARALCFYWIDKNYPAALQELAVAAKILPNDTDIDATVAYIRRRQGRWGEAIEALQRVLERDPRNGQIAEELSFTQYHVRDWAAAARSGDRAAALAPDLPVVTILRRYVDFWQRGDLASVRAALDVAPGGVDPDGFVSLARWDAALLARDYAAAERAVAACPLDPVPNFNGGCALPKSYLSGCIALARGDSARAHAQFTVALPSIEAEALTVAPQDAFRHAQLGLLYAYLGRKEDAWREGRLAVQLAPESADAHDGPMMAGYLALIYARTGEADQALALIQRLLTTPCAVDFYEPSITLADLRTRWQWDPLRDHPRFQRMIAGPEPPTVWAEPPVP